MVSSGGSLGAIHRRRRGHRQDKRYEARTRRTSKRRQSPLLGPKLSNFFAQEIYIGEITHGDTCVFIVLSLSHRPGTTYVN
jgi:hypothetical protein